MSGKDKPKPKKEKVPRQHMREQDPMERNKNFEQVNLGYTAELAVREANRCIQCKKPACVPGCPVEIDIPGFIKLITEEKFVEAARKIKETNCLPAVCGRVCPQEDQCEGPCVLGKKGEPVAIGHLERFAADYEREQGAVAVPELPPKTGYRVAVVGCGPGGMTVAGDLVMMGHEVTIFEALHKPGGVLVYGIPEFRLPKAVLYAEVDYLQKLGVKVETNAIIGKMFTIDELLGQEGFDAVFIAVGAGAPMFMNIPGENLNGVFSANEYLTRSNLMKAYQFPEYDTPMIRARNAVVIGGGNTAMDTVRTAKRLGAEHATIVYRRSRHELPAREEEIMHAEEEGIEFKFLTAPLRILSDENGWVRAMECIQMELGEPDESGRRRPVPIKGSEFEMEVDLVVVAIGTNANPLIMQTTPDLEINKWGYIVGDPETGATSKKGVFAGGDIVTGGATVILAMGSGKKSARAIHEYLQTVKK